MPEYKTLAIDIGGSHIKTTLLDQQGNIIKAYQRVDTPAPATPEKVLQAINGLIKDYPPYDKISVGFPGYVKEGVIETAPNLGTDNWKNVNLAEMLTKQFGKPARVINDADLLGLGVVSGKGLEMMITLGTGFGTAMFTNGKLLPHLELAHLPVTKKQTYDDYIGQKALDDVGTKKWNERLQKILSNFKIVFNYDTLYIGGGNSSKIKFELDPDIKIVNNVDGIHGGAKLWE